MKPMTLAAVTLGLGAGFLTATSSFTPAPPTPPAYKIPVVQMQWMLPDGTPEEQYVLQQIQNKTRITDRNALATILGNIKQESKFISNICEGGARVPYHDCHRGGYGLIQWTTLGRYKGLGSFAKKYGCDPSSLECQTRYMINEPIFQKYLPMFEGPGQTVRQYMVPAYYWLGWGIKGNRELYAYDYVKRLTYEESTQNIAIQVGAV